MSDDLFYDEEIGKLINDEIARFYSREERLVSSQYCFYKKKLYFYNEHDATRELGQFIESGHDSNYFCKSITSNHSNTRKTM